MIVYVIYWTTYKGDGKMKTIIFFNNKGGVGKTSTVNTVSHMMAEYLEREFWI